MVEENGGGLTPLSTFNREDLQRGLNRQERLNTKIIECYCYPFGIAGFLGPNELGLNVDFLSSKVKKYCEFFLQI